VRWAVTERSGNWAERHEENARQFLNVFGNEFYNNDNFRFALILRSNLQLPRNIDVKIVSLKRNDGISLVVARLLNSYVNLATTDHHIRGKRYVVRPKLFYGILSSKNVARWLAFDKFPGPGYHRDQSARVPGGR